MDTNAPTISFPVIRGLQANQVYYVAMWTYGMMKRVSIFDDTELDSFEKIQRTLSTKRVPEIKDYILNNRDTYVFSALTASIDKNVSFEPITTNSAVGQLKVSLNSKFIINDGQHRRKAILEAMDEDPSLANETIAVVFFVNTSTKRCQQMFSDLNGKGSKTGKAINTLFDHESYSANLGRDLVKSIPVFRKTTDFQKTSLAKRSKKLFTYSNIVSANSELMRGAATTKNFEDDLATCRKFWQSVVINFEHWQYVADNNLPASDIRDTSIASSGVVMSAIGRVGNELLVRKKSNWESYVEKLSKIDWRRNNPDWNDRVVLHDKISKSTKSILLAAAYIKQKLGLELDSSERNAESSTDFRI